MSDALQDLAARVVAWGDAKGILAKSDPVSQALKMLSEFGELADAVAKGDQAGIEDGIGDTAVTVILLAKLSGIGLDDVVGYYETAWDVGGWNHFNGDTKKQVLQVIVQIGAICVRVLERDFLLCGQVDIGVTLCHLQMIARSHDTTLCACLRGALEIIEARQGQMVNGVFVKEYADAQG